MTDQERSWPSWYWVHGSDLIDGEGSDPWDGHGIKVIPADSLKPIIERTVERLRNNVSGSVPGDWKLADDLEALVQTGESE